MKIEIGENNSLLVFLTKDEVHTLHLNENDFSFQDEASRKILQSVYRDAALSAGFVPQSYDKRVTELLPFSDGSMLLCFSFRVKKVKLKVTAHRKTRYKIYELLTHADFAALTENIAHTGCLPAGVYESEGKYRFVIDTHAAVLDNLLKEYASPVTDALALAATKEYWREVFAGESA
ncbi:MAG: hypothetical protein IKE65_01600 [Clostridia bacterium]|nr:hypothetical protein [Clostridia bacterium]